MKDTITLTQLVELVGIPRRTLYRMIKDGRFPISPIKGLSPRRWSITSVQKWQAGLK